MASEYDCDNDEDTPQQSANLMNVVRQYRATYDTKSKDFRGKSKKANVTGQHNPYGVFRALFHDVTKCGWVKQSRIWKTVSQTQSKSEGVCDRAIVFTCIWKPGLRL